MKEKTFRTCSYNAKTYIVPSFLFFVTLFILVLIELYFGLSVYEYLLCKKINEVLFPVFFTIGALFLTLKFNLIVTLEDKIYSRKEYEHYMYVEKKKYDRNLYQPLQQIIETLTVAMFVFLISALFNLLAILVKIKSIIFVSAGMSVLAIYYIGLSLYVYSIAISDLQKMYQKFNNDIKNKYSKIKDKQKEM